MAAYWQRVQMSERIRAHARAQVMGRPVERPAPALAVEPFEDLRPRPGMRPVAPAQPVAGRGVAPETMNSYSGVPGWGRVHPTDDQLRPDWFMGAGLAVEV